MTKRTHFTPHNHRPREFRAGDRVKHVLPNRPECATFVAYCPGYLSHCMVQWDDLTVPSRIKATNLTLIERNSGVE